MKVLINPAGRNRYNSSCFNLEEEPSKFKTAIEDTIDYLVTVGDVENEVVVTITAPKKL